jgi:type VI secretion system secreted protein Hcp
MRVKVPESPQDSLGSRRAGRHTISRRRFVGRAAAGAAGVAVGAWVWVPLLSHAQTTAPPPRTPPTGTAAPGAGAATPTPLPKPQVQRAPLGQGAGLFLEFIEPAQGATAPLTGESADPAHPRTVELVSGSLGIRNPTTVGSVSGGAGAGKPQFEALRIVKNVDVTSPTLLMAAGQGTSFPQVNVYVRRGGGDDLVTYRFAQARVAAIAIASSDDNPQETVDFVFGAMDITYPGGTTGGIPGTAAWSVVNNQPVFEVGP